MEVSQLMEKDVKAISSERTGLDAAELMSEEEIGSLVVTENEEVRGIVTERDIIHKVAATTPGPAEVKVKEIMTPEPKTIEKGSTVEDAIQVMKENKLEHLPVVSDGKLVGIITSHEVFLWELKEEKYEELRTLPRLLKKK